MKPRPVIVAGTVAAALAIVTQPACEASLESECVGGDGTCDLHDPTTASSSSSSGVGGSGAGGGPVCYEGCETATVSGNTGEFPCDVDEVLEKCRACHTEPQQNGAPFSLETYEDSQQLYFDVAIWARLQNVLDSDFMPLGGPPLSSIEKSRVLDDWACQCAPPRPAGETCN